MAKKHKVVYNACYGGFSLSKAAIEMLAEMGVEEAKAEFNKTGLWESYRIYDLPRHDKRLVKVVEKLGEKAGGAFADLKIAKINGNKYRIDEYDGAESVIEPEDQEWVEIK